MIRKNLGLLLCNMTHFHVEVQYILVFIEELNESVSELDRMIREFIVTQI